MSPAIINIPERETYEEDVIGFLDNSEDFNPIHRGNLRIMPGMFYLNLAARSFMPDRKITKISIKFEKPVQFPVKNLIAIVESSEQKQDVIFKVKEENLAEISFNYTQENNACMENLQRLALVYKIPGDLQRVMKSAGVYLKQSAELMQQVSGESKLEFREPKWKSEIGFYDTYYSSNGQRVLGGKAIVTRLTKDFLEIIGEMTRIPTESIGEMLDNYAESLNA